MTCDASRRSTSDAAAAALPPPVEGSHTRTVSEELRAAKCDAFAFTTSTGAHAPPLGTRRRLSVTAPFGTTRNLDSTSSVITRALLLALWLLLLLAKPWPEKGRAAASTEKGMAGHSSTCVAADASRMGRTTAEVMVTGVVVLLPSSPAEMSVAFGKLTRRATCCSWVTAVRVVVVMV